MASESGNGNKLISAGLFYLVPVGLLLAILVGATYLSLKFGSGPVLRIAALPVIAIGVLGIIWYAANMYFSRKGNLKIETNDKWSFGLSVLVALMGISVYSLG